MATWPTPASTSGTPSLTGVPWAKLTEDGAGLRIRRKENQTISPSFETHSHHLSKPAVLIWFCRYNKMEFHDWLILSGNQKRTGKPQAKILTAHPWKKTLEKLEDSGLHADADVPLFKTPPKIKPWREKIYTERKNAGEWLHAHVCLNLFFSCHPS